MRTTEQLIESFGMIPIPGEGAWYAAGPRTAGLSSILVLLARKPEGFSALHRLDVDEGWQWLDGDPVALLQLRGSGGRGRGKGSLTLLDATARQLLVPRWDWQGAATLGNWSLLACWCAPAFEERHFTLGDGEALAREYPEYAAEIRLLSRPLPPARGRHAAGAGTTRLLTARSPMVSGRTLTRGLHESPTRRSAAHSLDGRHRR